MLRNLFLLDWEGLFSTAPTLAPDLAALSNLQSPQVSDRTRNDKRASIGLSPVAHTTSTRSRKRPSKVDDGYIYLLMHPVTQVTAR